MLACLFAHLSALWLDATLSPGRAHPANISEEHNPMADLTDIRLAIASQPTVEQSLLAFVRAISSQLADASISTDPGAIERVSVYLKSNVKAVHDAILANTPQAIETATLTTPVPDQETDIAGQSSLGQGLVAFIRDLNQKLTDADGDPDAINGVIDHLRKDPEAIAADIKANTPLSQVNATLGTPVPSYVAGAFAGAPEPGAVEPQPENAAHVQDKHITDTGETGTNPPPDQNPGFGAMTEITPAHPAPEPTDHQPAPPHPEHVNEPPNAPPHGEPPQSEPHPV